MTTLEGAARTLSSEARGLRVIVSGASGGIGSALVEHLVALDCAVAAVDMAFDQSHFPDSRLITRHIADLRDWDATEQAIQGAVESMDGCDAVIANAAIVDTLHRAERFSREDWYSDIDVNLTGAYRLAQCCFPALKQAGRGRLVFISSIAATMGQPAQIAYAASKAGLIGIARTLAVEWAPYGITTNVVLPGLIATPKVSRLGQSVRNEYMTRIPLARFGLPAEIAGTVAFVLSPAAGYLNGAVIAVDGGFGLNNLALTTK